MSFLPFGRGFSRRRQGGWLSLMSKTPRCGGPRAAARITCHIRALRAGFFGMYHAQAAEK